MNVQIRNVSPRVHKELKRRASANHLSLSEYLNSLFEKHVAMPSREQWLRQLKSATPIELDRSAVELLSEARQEDELELISKLAAK